MSLNERRELIGQAALFKLKGGAVLSLGFGTKRCLVGLYGISVRLEISDAGGLAETEAL